MNKILILIMLLPLFNLNLQAEFKSTKEGKYNFYYDKNLNIYSLKYIIKQVNKFDKDFRKKFSFTNNNPLNIYLYNDTVKFINEQKGMWWQNYIIKHNLVAINNIDLLLQKNSLRNLVKYIIYRDSFIIFFKNRLPVWLINGLAIYYSDANMFENKNLQFVSFNEFIYKLDNYTTKEECEQANYNCCKSIKYLFNNHGEDKILKYFKTIRTRAEFKNKFFDYFKITYEDLIHISLNL